MINKKNKKIVEKYRKAVETAKPINEKIENELRKIIKNGESLDKYEIWINEKCKEFIKIDYIIDIKIKNFEEEKEISLKTNVPINKLKDMVCIIVKKGEN